MRFHVVLQGSPVLEYQPAYRANPLLATVHFMGIPRMYIEKLGRTALHSTGNAFYAQMSIPVLLEAFLRGEALWTLLTLDAVRRRRRRQWFGWFRLVAVPPMASVDSVRREAPLAQFAEDVPRQMFHVGDIGLGRNRRIRVVTSDCVMPFPVGPVVESLFEPLRADHALVIVLSVASHVDPEGVTGFEFISAFGANVTSFLLAIPFM